MFVFLGRSQLSTRIFSAYSLTALLFLVGCTASAQDDRGEAFGATRYQALVDGLLSTRHAARVDDLLRSEPGVIQSRTDHATRNMIIDVQNASTFDPLLINNLLGRVHVTVSCMRRTSPHQAFIPMSQGECELTPVVTTVRGTRGWEDDYELCMDPYEVEGWPVDFGSPAHIATLEFDGFCCNEWGDNCQTIYDAYSPPGSNCDAVIPDDVDMDSPAFASAISSDPFCCTYEWDSFCDDLYNWSIPPLGCDSYTLEVSAGTVPGISWSLVGGTTIVRYWGCRCGPEPLYAQWLFQHDHALARFRQWMGWGNVDAL